ncbi:phosphatidylinositol-specific phospholipase C domain-containing protein [Flavobacterium columnare]|uniref:1-phosphatidylinositol phosphodiesterase n=1 Tax=Flavobacterium columnare TaxID=996 RepID=A0A437UBZ2_9FLAO|nr:phosphatidylinositol-specific phospholipase C domain-containing protein [Flavobacterium columnare]RVU91121.1 phosphatidylinositol-specific phospholipase C domain-containing protein [Flavobacterium columnare]
MKKTILGMALLAILQSCTSDSLTPTLNESTERTFSKDRVSTNVTKNNWMSAIRSNIPLSKLSIPGTHDSMSINNWAFSSNQYGSIKDQLEAGARIFDLRFNYENGQFMGYHGIIKLNITLDQIMSHFNDFLKVHPKEVIITILKKENGGDKSIWVNYFNTKMSEYESKGLVKKNWNTNTLLGDCRGKVLPLSRETYTNSTFVQGWSGDPNFSNGTLISDDHYNPFKISDFYTVNTILPASINYKYDRIVDNINRSNSDSNSINTYLTYCSGASAFAYPVAVADRINPKVADYIKGNKLKSCGWILMDFINSEKGNRLSENCIGVSINNFSN